MRISAQRKRKIRANSHKYRTMEWHWLKLAEEASELSDAILKTFTRKHGYENVYKEMVDVLIAMRLLQDKFNYKIWDMMREHEDDKYLSIEKHIQKIIDKGEE